MESEYLIQEYKAPSSIASLLPPLPVKKTKNLGERQQLINRICYELKIDKHYSSGIFWQSNGLVTNDELTFLKEEALKFKANPRALFRKMLKIKCEEVKLKLKQQ